MSARRAHLRKKKHRLTVDVGAFLSIIVCIIGIVVLMIGGLVAAGSLQEKDDLAKKSLLDQIAQQQSILDAQAALLQRNHDAQLLKQHLTDQLASLDRDLAAQNLLDDQLALAQKHSSALQKQMNDPEFLAREDLLRQIAKAKIDFASVENERKVLPAQIDSARRLAQDAQSTATIPMMPASSQVRPVFVECQAAGLTVYNQEGADIQEYSVAVADIPTDEQFAATVKKVADAAKNGSDVVLNFLVRPEGVKAYDKALSTVSDAAAPFSSVPIVVTGKIRFRQPTVHTNP